MHFLSQLLLLAAHKSSLETSTSSGGKGLSLSWAIVIFLTLLGLAISLIPAKRTYEVKRPKDE
jgi:hypothetical protein